MIRNKKIIIANKVPYTPIQPTATAINNSVVYQEIRPDISLCHFVYCYWQLQTKKVLDQEYRYRVVADGCIDIFFEADRPDKSYVIGFCNNFVEFPIGKKFNYIGIRFLPTMFTQLFDYDASELSNSYRPLQDVLPGTASFLSGNYYGTVNSDSIQSILDVYFRDLVKNKIFSFDSRIYNALSIILNAGGNLNVRNNLDVGLSERQLRRLFKYYIGATVKKFCKVIRFQNVLLKGKNGYRVHRDKLFYDLGYYDQSHFIKDFKTLYGTTPQKS